MKESLKRRIESIEKKEIHVSVRHYRHCRYSVRHPFTLSAFLDCRWHLFLNCCEAGYRFSQMEKKAENGKGSQEDDRKSRLKKKV